jgi:hypothetical protein
MGDDTQKSVRTLGLSGTSAPDMCGTLALILIFCASFSSRQ